jgi:hypothetical protein
LRLAAARDKNESGIVKALEKTGRMVTRLSARGVPDLLVIMPGADVPVYQVESEEQALDIAMAQDQICLIEVKSPGGKLTIGQKEWHSKAFATNY